MVSDYSGLEGEEKSPEQQIEPADLHSLLQPGEEPGLDDNSLDEIVSDYKPNLLMKGLVAVLKGTSTPVDHIDYSQMKKPEQLFRKYIVRPITRPRDYFLTPLAGFGVRIMVGGTSGEIMTEAADYLEKELGIKETPLEYTRNHLLSCLTVGLFTMLGLIGVGISIPTIIPTSAALAPLLSVVNPLAYAGDMTRRLWLYSQGKPSGPWMFEAVWWIKNKVNQYAVPPFKRAYENYVAPAVDNAKQFYTEKIGPQLENILENFQYCNNPFYPTHHSNPFYSIPYFYQSPTECDDQDDAGTKLNDDAGTKESILYDYTVKRLNDDAGTKESILYDYTVKRLNENPAEQ